MRVPEAFEKRMKERLGEAEWLAYAAAVDGEAYKGVRANTLKITPEELQEKLPFVLERVAWEENGVYTQEKKLGGNPYHFAGVFYSQEPSAMCAAPLLEVKAGERVLDLCSAPGGKGTRLAADLNGEGLIVLNEPIFSRAKILLQNTERMGIKNAVVTSEYPQSLEKRFPEYFDKIMVDAPCSGEGMFRKNAEEALSEWSEENVTLCALRQAEILESAAKMLAVGGRMVYSTCTFAEEEDEWQVERFLKEHPEFSLVKAEKLYPHKVKGEGHFAAVFVKNEGGRYEPKQKKTVVSKQAEKAWKEFEKEFFLAPFARNLHEVEGSLYELPQGVFDFTKLSVLRVGVKLGEMKNGRFEPSHALAMSVKKEELCAPVELTLEETDRYLRGEAIEKDGKKGWRVALFDGYPIGLGKCVDGVFKNHLPKGLRKVN
jgi:16S rRNA C967 or C1407 C5-methylase (RsmB/RsmF family)